MAADPLDSLRLPVVPVDPRQEFSAALLRRIRSGAAGAALHRIRSGAAGPRDHPTVRYFVGDLDAAIEFYCQRLGFEEELRSAPAFAMLYGGGLRLLLSVPGLPGAGRALPDGTVPAAGGSNRITLQVTDVTAAVAELRAAGVRIRADVSAGVAVRQALIEDPAGNLVELFEPGAGYHERSSAP
jgi:catechol 2,3-dioxygenase-like lactoylglutathione lyase family enzyme